MSALLDGMDMTGVGGYGEVVKVKMTLEPS
jgi:hypothetical protein